MSDKNTVEAEKAFMANLNWKRPLIVTRGRGALLWDSDEVEYIDCTSNYGVAIVGHSHPKIIDAVQMQAEKLMSCHSTFYNDARSRFITKLMTVAPSGMDQAFLSNSGAESVEFALKLARRATGKKEVIAMMGAYHGKTMGALSATWSKKYRAPFEPLVPGFKHVPFGDIERIEGTISDRTAAIIVEPIQGESGVNLPPDSFLPELEELCNENDILLILDEVQTGMGRTGKMFACQHWDVTPDIMCLAKGIASGLPLGVTLAREEIMSTLRVGEHSSTFGGSPLACAAGAATIDVLNEEQLPDRARELGRHVLGKLNRLEHRIIREVRGLGLMIAIELRFDVLNILLNSMKRGILFLDAGRNIVRLLPPLVIGKAQMDKAISVLDDAIEEDQNARLRG